MKFLTISKTLLILIMPFLLLLIASNFVGFDKKFYHEKFLEYGVQKDIPNAVLLHETVINFIKGKDFKLPDEFNEREKQHLIDVKRIIIISKLWLYILMSSFILLFVISILVLKSKKLIINFISKILISGGLLSLTFAMILLIFSSFDFLKVFELFHILLFKSGTYTFDPSTDIIIKIYPEQLFMELGKRMLKAQLLTSFIITSIGIFLMLKSKRINFSYDNT